MVFGWTLSRKKANNMIIFCLIYLRNELWYWYVTTDAEHLSLSWYERDRLMSYIDSLKCDEFKKNPEEHFNEIKIVNFAMKRLL